MRTLGSMNVDVITLFVEDLSINLLNISEAHGLIAPGKVANQESGSRFQFTIRVDDVNAVCNELHTCSIPLLNGPMDRPWGARTAAFADPAGHVWEIAQQLD